MTRRYDLDALRNAVTIRDVLAAHGFELRRSRSRCPLHRGDNATSFSVTRDGQRFTCFACDARGDVIDLVAKLNAVDFLGAVAIVARTAGLNVEQVPRLDADAAARAAKIARRRRNLRAWRDARLSELVVEICELESDARWLSDMAIGARGRGVGALVEHWLDLLAHVYAALAAAEWTAAQLERDDEREWARLWLEHRRT